MTGEIDIRALDKRNVGLIAEYLAHPDLVGLTGLSGDRGLSLSEDEISEGVEKWRTDEHGFVRLIDVDGAVAGHLRCGWWWDALTPWIEIVVRPDRRNEGLGTRAGHWILEHLFTNTPAHVVHASTADWNEHGIRLAERLGFERAGLIRRTGIRGGRYVGTVEFELLRTRWEGTDATQR